MKIKRIALQGILAVCSLLLAACMAQPQPAPVDANTLIMLELKDLRTQLESLRIHDQLQAAAPREQPISVQAEVAAPLNENSQLETITYSRETGRIIVTYSNKTPTPPPETTASLRK